MSEAPAPPPLSATEARILGCLVEKEATTPDVYPLTVNNIVMACNQKTARDPVMALEQGAVHHALRQLEVRGLVRSQHTARAERYGHRFEVVYGLTPPQTALMSLLLLRGPQTVHELYGRSERLARFEDAEEVARVLERLMQKEPALVAVLPRKSGQREDRYRHLLVPSEIIDAGDDEVQYEASSEPGVPSLRERIAALEARVEALEAKLAALLPGDSDDDAGTSPAAPSD
ncbi:MAG: YceH family protein [Xanthomonadaceae bacterium]|nr:YceH family protein [Xanthomonadaceae bacterium]